MGPRTKCVMVRVQPWRESNEYTLQYNSLQCVSGIGCIVENSTPLFFCLFCKTFKCNVEFQTARRKPGQFEGPETFT